MTTFYTAGKVWHAPKFQELRDEIGMPVQARWIDLTTIQILFATKRMSFGDCVLKM